MSPRNKVGSLWFTAANGLIVGSAVITYALGGSLPFLLITVALATQCELIRYALRASERERRAHAEVWHSIAGDPYQPMTSDEFDDYLEQIPPPGDRG